MESSTSQRAVVIASILMIGSFAVFAALAPNALTNGDPAVYAQQIKRADFSGRTTHIGYYLIASVLTIFAPDFSDRALNLLNCFFGAATLGVGSLLAIALGGGRIAAITAALVLISNHLVVLNSLHAEVYIVQTFFLVLALYLWLRRWPVAAGLAFGVATLVTPSTLLAAPAFPLLRPRLKALLRLGFAAAAILAACLGLVLEDYLWGPRGLLRAASGLVDLRHAAAKEGFELIFGFFAFLPLVVLGLGMLAAKPSLRRPAWAVAIMWSVTLIFGEKFVDVPVQLPTYVVLGAVAGLAGEKALSLAAANEASTRSIVPLWLLAGATVPVTLLWVARPFSNSIDRLPERLPAIFLALLLAAAAAATFLTLKGEGRWAAIAAIATQGLLCVTLTGFFVLQKNRDIVAYRAAVLAVDKVAAPDYLVVGPWSHGILFEHYVYGRSYTGQWLDVALFEGLKGTEKEREAQRAWGDALGTGREVWLLRSYPGFITELESHDYEVEPFRQFFRARRLPTEEDIAPQP